MDLVTPRLMFDNLSIRYKLVVLLGMSAAVALAISSVVTLYSTFVSQKEGSLRVLRQLADITSENMRAALAFHDADSARNMLAPMQANPHILLAAVDDEEGKPLGSYVKAGLAANEAERYRREMQEAVQANLGALFGQRKIIQQATLDHMYVLMPIQFEGKPIGILAIISDTADVREEMARFVIFQLLVSIVTLAVLVVISIRLQKLFTKPIFDLIEAMQQVSATKNYAVTIASQRSDEFCDLYADFNAMLVEIRDRDDKLNRLATTDALTGLANRRHAMEAMESMVARSARRREPIGTIIIDVDFFKKINDTFGHPVGDAVIKEIAKILLGSAREYDLVARIGGEEFLVLCDASDMDETRAIAERIRASVEDCNMEYAAGKYLKATVSLGIYAAVPGEHDVEKLIKIADDALYRAKESGRNRVVTGEQM